MPKSKEANMDTPFPTKDFVRSFAQEAFETEYILYRDKHSFVQIQNTWIVIKQ